MKNLINRKPFKWGISLVVIGGISIGVYTGTEDWRAEREKIRNVENHLKDRLQVAGIISEDDLEVKSVKKKEHPTMEIYTVTYTSEELKEQQVVDEPILLLKEQGEMSMTEYDYLTKRLLEHHKDTFTSDVSISLITSLSFAEAYDLFMNKKYDRYDFDKQKMRIILNVKKLDKTIEDEAMAFIEKEGIRKTDLEVVLFDLDGNEKQFNNASMKFEKV